MGAILSTLLGPLKPLVTAIGILRDLAKQFSAADARFNEDPGLPRAAPTRPFWLDEPPFPELADIQSEILPEQADVIIIGSGISGVAIARSLFEASPSASVVVVEARQLCSGATGRNGGHIKASPHETIEHLITKLGMPGERAAALVRFQLAHLENLVALCESDADLLAISECRKVETVDLIVEDKIFTDVKHSVALLNKWVPEFKMTTWSAAEAQQKFSAGPHVVGAVTYDAGALWPYRFVTALWRHLLDAHPDLLSIETSTPAEAVATDRSTPDYPYRVTTPRGTIRARHVVHATNAFASHLLPELRRKVTGLRAHMSAQRPGPKFPDLDGARSWSIIYNAGFDYISQRPSRTVRDGETTVREAGEVMTGGGFVRSADQGLDQLGVFDDTTTDFFTGLHLHGILPTTFGPYWGSDAANSGRTDYATGEGHVTKLWSGIIGFSADMIPLVGRLESKITGRSLAATKRASSTTGTGAGAVEPGEWISAVFQGDGMVWAWLSGTALGIMLAGREQEDLPPAPGRPSGCVVDWFPKEMRPTHDRLKKIDITNLADLLL
ncbi:fad dependent oxidoreductase [Ophiostoma piceae UAMH 11346]|uniref:Fad dependent oxidoreductase n=1 Tax=Ophiostoma piceae (strain UAMH 11346) TaxID=1262450 RepID=S3C6Y0_OPHP1|nr:fad dependent oxidoreductase [Ophiostoma piceae UAMH 11346]